MSHGCLKVDAVICTAQSLAEIGNNEDDNINKWVESIAIETKDLLDYLDMANNYIAPITLTDTLIMCSSVCSSIF